VNFISAKQNEHANSLVKHLQDRIADAQHDIESIEIHLVKQDDSSISAGLVQDLRGLQKYTDNASSKLDAESTRTGLRRGQLEKHTRMWAALRAVF
jgi:hypothetical protein